MIGVQAALPSPPTLWRAKRKHTHNKPPKLEGESLAQSWGSAVESPWHQLPCGHFVSLVAAREYAANCVCMGKVCKIPFALMSLRALSIKTVSRQVRENFKTLFREKSTTRLRISILRRSSAKPPHMEIQNYKADVNHNYMAEPSMQEL